MAPLRSDISLQKTLGEGFPLSFCLHVKRNLLNSALGASSKNLRAFVYPAKVGSSRGRLALREVVARRARTSKSLDRKGKGNDDKIKSAKEKVQAKEQYKYFDRAVINVKGGNGGHGEILSNSKARTVRNFKYKSGGNMSKKITLPSREPANGADGGDVFIFVDPSLDSLLHLHENNQHVAPSGSNANSGEIVSLRARGKEKRNKAPSLRIPVPPGTVVRTKRTGKLIADLTDGGQMVCVAKGGFGGVGMEKTQKKAKQRRQQDEEGVEDVTVEVSKQMTAGEPGEEFFLELLLRVVADVGLVGFPNVGKSSLLAHLTRANPEIANYPFTTLMPNLGVAQGDQNPEDGEPEMLQPVMADLPGLIEGAHKGRGLGREFLRHLRRTKIIVHVVDAAELNPVEVCFLSAHRM